MTVRLYDIELAKAAKALVEDMLCLQAGETVVITADTETNHSVVASAAGAVFAAGAKPMVITTATPPGVSKAADPTLPTGPLAGALQAADAWLEFNNQWILYSTPYAMAMGGNPRLRHICLTGASAGTMVRCVGELDYPALREFEALLAARLAAARHVRMASRAGCDIVYEQAPVQPMLRGHGSAGGPGTHFMAGQITWTPLLSTMTGKIVLDGSVYPAVGVLRQPVCLEVQEGRIVDVEGGREAAAYRRWMESFGHPQMGCIAHAGLGFHPRAKLAGNVMEDQRVWGSATWGVGSVGAALLPPDGIPAPSHSDAISLDISLWLDEEPIIRDGAYVEPELHRLSQRLIAGSAG